MRNFGWAAHIMVTRSHAKNLDERSIKTVLMGHEPGSKAYRVYDPSSGRLHITRGIVFNDANGCKWADTGEVNADDTCTIEYMVSNGDTSAEPVSPDTSPATAPVGDQSSAPSMPVAYPVTFASPSSHNPSDMDLED